MVKELEACTCDVIQGCIFFVVLMHLLYSAYSTWYCYVGTSHLVVFLWKYVGPYSARNFLYIQLGEIIALPSPRQECINTSPPLIRTPCSSGGGSQRFSSRGVRKDLALARPSQERAEERQVLPAGVRAEGRRGVRQPLPLRESRLGRHRWLLIIHLVIRHVRTIPSSLKLIVLWLFGSLFVIWMIIFGGCIHSFRLNAPIVFSVLNRRSIDWTLFW